MKQLLMHTCAASVLVFAGPAFAQGAVGPQQRSNSSGVQIEEIVVTAQKRAENMQEVPITVSAFNQEALATLGSGSTRDLSNLVPGLVFNKTIGSGTPFLRGVGQTTGAAGVEPPVSFYFDGVYFPTAGSTVLSLGNVEQVAVIKGPQGTLFGRNSTGGVIQVTTRTPSAEPELDWDLGYGNYDTIQGRFYASTPVGGMLRTSLAVSGLDQREGWGRNVSLNKEIFTRSEFVIQSKSVLDFNENSSLTLNLLATRGAGYVGTTLAVPPGSIGSDRITRYISEYDVPAGADTESTVRQLMGSLTFDQDFGWSRLRVLGSAQTYKDNQAVVQNGLPFGTRSAILGTLRDKTKTYTAEIQLQSPDAQDFRWIGGVFLFADETEGKSLFFSDRTLLSDNLAVQDTESWAVFGEVSKSIIPNLRLTAGARYTDDTKEVEGRQLTATGALVATFASAGAANGFSPKSQWGEATYKLALDYKLTEDVMLFASYNRGFKSGLYNIFNLTNRPADPEQLDAYEIGAKTSMLDGRIRLNVSGFLYEYANIQLRTVLPPSSAFIIYNAAEARMKGIDVEFTAAVSDSLSLNAGFEVLDATYLDFRRAACTAPAPTGGNITFQCDRSGARAVRSPRLTATLGVQYRIELPGGGQLELAANDGYNSGFLWEASGRTEQEAYHSVSASIKWSPREDKYYVRLWGSNLLDEKIRANQGEAANDVYSPGAPLTYGVTVGGHF